MADQVWVVAVSRAMARVKGCLDVDLKHSLVVQMWSMRDSHQDDAKVFDLSNG